MIKYILKYKALIVFTSMMILLFISICWEPVREKEINKNCTNFAMEKSEVFFPYYDTYESYFNHCLRLKGIKR